ncbi:MULTISPECIES: diaminopimelate epimerase [unclassified Sulfitobacter]|uniref:diaminopimelate epimerase n=1 Tax=unclassified Sulfitobacter TaxID=196795 RepID=UPI0007C26BDE|nr:MULTISPECIES: diaminopimelate epimerase [unclassified Sulfitobacter]KZY03999.1 diaminopimelate epimerase [Sulfitobacter sp. HI0023]KZY26220.1 diaminopimelate epimerase [Sulfitobacter sp. HI0040]KZZ71594.1 diaminopimelate epimerase [Sulfitobacter sp. HI0129]
MRRMSTGFPNGLPFMKMHGLGNDFVVVDARQGQNPVTDALACGIADRHRGVGFDQLAVIGKPDDGAVRLTFYNADGSLSAACGNATRCIARYLMDESGDAAITLKTERGLLEARDAGRGLTSVNMLHPQLDWQEIPLVREMDTLVLPIEGEPTATGMGNPHCSFFVADAEAADLEDIGARMEHHPLFPQRTNVQLAQIVGTDHIRMRVWERGVGVTLASGSSSCAVAVAAARRGLTGRSVKIDLDGGTLDIDWREDGVWMTGPTMHVFSGALSPAFLESLA